MPLPSGFKIDSQERKISVPAGFVFDEPDSIKQSSYAAPKGFILDEITESSPSLKQGQPPTMFERGKEAISDIFRKDPGLGPLSEEDYAAFKPADISMSKKEKDRQKIVEQKSPGLLAPEPTVPPGMEGMPESAIPAGMSMDIPARRAEINKRLEQINTELSTDNIEGLQSQLEKITSRAVDGALPPDLYEQYIASRSQYEKAVEDYNAKVTEAQKLIGELQDLRQQEYGMAMARPISTITGKLVPAPEEKAVGGKAAMALAPYGFASAVRGMIPGALEKAIMRPITKVTIGRKYVSPIDEALKASGKYLPKGAQKVIGAPARMAGAAVPLNISLKTANAIMKAAGLPTDLVLSTGPVVDQIAGHIARGGFTGAIYGALEKGTPKGMAEDAAFFGALEGGLGAAGKIFEKIFSSNWYRNLEVPERGLVVQTADDLRRAGHSEGTILRTLSDPVERKRLLEEAAKKRMAPEGPSVDLTANEKRFEENPLDAENNAEYLNKYIEKAKQPKPPAISPPEEILPIESKLTHRALPLKPEEEPSKEIKMKKASEKIKAETPTMLKKSDKVNDVTLETLVDMATKDPAKALKHAEEATVSKAKLIEGLRNKGLKAMGEAKSKEERTEIAKNLEETLRGVEKGGKPTYVRIEEAGKPDISKPQGLYLAKKGKEILVEGLEGTKYEYKFDPKNPLKIEDELLVKHKRGRGLTFPASSGIKALKKLVGEKEFDRLMHLSKKNLSDELGKKYSGVDWDKYYDSYEMLEGYAGKLARDKGYDSIIGDPEEVVALNPQVLTEVAAKGIERRKESKKPELGVPKEPKSAEKAPPIASEAESKGKQPWEMTREEWEEAGEKIKQSVIIADGKIFKAPTHAEAINKAIEQGFVRETSDGLRTKKGDYPEIDLFETDRGRIVNRFIADEIAAVTAGENIGKGGNHKKLVQYAINQNKPVPEKVLAEYPELKPPGKPKEPIATFLSSKKKAGVNYEMKVKIAETGEVITITKDAAEALRETKKELSRYEKLLACLSS